MLDKFRQNTNEEDESHWLSVGDLMSGLMMIFLFIAIALMHQAYEQRDKVKQVAETYQARQNAIYLALTMEFASDLEEWNADIDEETLTFTFNSPDVLFKTGQIELSAEYKKLLGDFFPRYMAVLEPYKDWVHEVRIEGHTSSIWNHSTEKESYFRNMDLSQGRTRAVLEFVYNLDTSEKYRDWIKSHFAAVGFSSSKLVYDENGNEDAARSRRVSFRVISNADTQIKKILEGNP